MDILAWNKPDFKEKFIGSIGGRVHTGPGNREKVGDFKQAFSRPGIAGKLSILGDWSGNRREF